jgi:Ca2+-binding EF-hand superfamily protein
MENELREMFNFYDKNDNGTIEAKELKFQLKELFGNDSPYEQLVF